MPLAGGYSRESISKNIKREKRAGKRHNVAIAIALEHARAEARRRGKRPHHLFGTKSARSYLKRRAARHSRRR